MDTNEYVDDVGVNHVPDVAVVVVVGLVVAVAHEDVEVGSFKSG